MNILKSKKLKFALAFILVATLTLLGVSTTGLLTIINITEWHVYTRRPPIVKIAGEDAATKYVNVTWTTASDGKNVTVITITAFVGDITKYSSVLIIKNNDPNLTYNVTLIYKGTGGAWPADVKYVKLTFGEDTLLLTSGTPIDTSAGPVTLAPGQSVTIGVETLVSANATIGAEIIKIIIHVEAVQV